MPTQSPELADVIRAALTGDREGIYTSLPGAVQAYDSTTNSVDVKPLIKQAYFGEGGARVADSLPIIPSVPVSFPGSGAWSITWPLSVGDTGMIMVSHSSLDRWLASTGAEVDPGDDRRHCLADAWFLPGVRPFTAPVPAARTAAMVIAGADVRIGDASAALLATKADVTNILAFLKLQFDNVLGHVHASPGAPPTTGTGTGAGFTMPTVTGTTKAKGT